MNETVQSQNDTTNSTEPKSSNDKCVVTGIYGLRNKTNGKWYVGQSFDVLYRWDHYRKLNCKNQPKLYKALKKYGYDNFENVLFETCEPVEWILDYREMYWIRHLDTIANGYNLREGGSHGRHSEESKQKCRLASLGHKHTEETKNKLREIRKRQVITDVHRKNLSIAHTGKKVSEKTRQKLRLIAIDQHRRNGPVKLSEDGRRRCSEAAKRRWELHRTKLSNPTNILGQITVVESVQ